ncbi:exonuclease [Ruegeria sp. HKCCA6707]|uniref:exonuclease n=1 Tax=Ruegeria sp. HKCCA6707 TaxID=2682996 RepID=UPI0014879509|nr:exonuclease [Ruegeria sp. HKCCA6707]
MGKALIFDCEFLTAPGSPSRFWCGPYDPDPVVAQIGVTKLGLTDPFPILDSMRIYVVPKDRNGNRIPLDPFFTKLTGITEDNLDADGVSLLAALKSVEEFAEGAKLWSWGKDEFNMVAISCYVEGVAPPLPASQFGNACDLLLKAGMPYEDLKTTRSNTLKDYYQIDHPDLRGHAALDDALSVAYVLQHLLGQEALVAQDFS